MGTSTASASPQATRLAERLLAWGARERRDLPWRRTRDPWAVLVAEVMLQQTQVSRARERYPDFLARFPTPHACAAAPTSVVLTAWSGLGYNRRARDLQRAAAEVVARHDGRLPDRLEGLLALPGVGSYTARAVLAFAFGQDHGVVDTNASRVLARAVAGERLTAARAQQLADEQVPRGRGWEWNQAVLDLGAGVCTRRRPGCGRCPLVDDCVWAARGFAEPDPAEGSAGASGRQSTFEGSDRQGRGRLVRALTAGPVALERVPEVAGWPDEPERASRVAASLVADGLAEVAGGRLALPS